MLFLSLTAFGEEPAEISIGNVIAASGDVEDALKEIRNNIESLEALHGTVVETALKAEQAFEVVRSGSEEEVTII